METGQVNQRQPAGDRERALAFGSEFGLGTLEGVSTGRKLHKYVGLGIASGVVVLFVGIPVATGVSGGPYPAAGKVVTDVIVAALFAGCCGLLGAGRARTATTTRLYRYSDGLAQLVGDEPEPRVARWADVRDFTVDYRQPEDMLPRLNGFQLTAGDGMRLPGISGQPHRRELRALVAEATLNAWYPPGELVPWSQVKSVHLTYIDPRDGRYVNEVVVGRKGGPTEEIRVELLTNGIFLPALLSHAARRHGVLVTGYHGDGGGIPAALLRTAGTARCPGPDMPGLAAVAERPGPVHPGRERHRGGGTMSEAAPDSVYALLADGRTVEIRPAVAADFAAVKAMHEAMSPGNVYLRFFSLSRLAAEQEARRVTRPPGPGHAALLAVFDGQVAGLASFEADRAGGRTAEVAFAVADTMHHRGIATLLLEHLVSLARARQLEALTAETLPENTGMLRVFSEAGLPVNTRRVDGVVTVTIPLPPDDAGRLLEDYLDTVAVRERRASVASLRPVFAPRSVAVIGASRRTGTVGRSVLDNIVAGGFKGELWVVNPGAAEIGGVPSFPGVDSLPGAPDLAVLAVPPAAVTETAEACGRRGARGLVVLTADIDAVAGADLLAACRRYGMRLIGPNCFGIAVPSIGLDATFAAAIPAQGSVGLVMQSGGIGFAMVDHLSRLGIGISSFASVGNKLDVSSNDLLQWWEQDDQTRLAVLYIESFGNPRKFGRTARRVGLKMPVLTVHVGRSAAGSSAAGKRAAPSHTAVVATPLVTREALFEQAGIIATPSFGELMGATALLATQEPPAGRTVAIVSNVDGAGVLAADACTDLGLAVHHPDQAGQGLLRAIVPAAASVDGPVDTAATVSAEQFRQVLETLGADEQVHAVIALVLRTGATGDLLAAIAAAHIGVPLAVVVLNQPEAVRLVDGRGGKVPAYAYPEVAARALSRAVRYAEWRAAPRRFVPAFPDADAEQARRLVQDFLARQPAGGWLPPPEVTGLLQLYRIPLDPATVITGGTAGGAEVRVEVRDDQMFGPLVVLGPGGAAGDEPADHAARLTPLTEADADTLISAIRPAFPLSGRHGVPAADRSALRDVLLRVSRLSDDLPEIAELDLNPVITRPDSAVAAAARIRVAPQVPQDPFLRRLR